MVVISILVLFAVMLELTEFLYKKTEYYKNSLGIMQRFHEPIPEDLDIVNIGSGPGYYAINYEYSDVKGFNFSTAPQSFEYGYKLLRNYSKKIKKHAIIIIIIMCPLSFGANNDYKRKDYSDKFYGVLPPSMISDYSWTRAIKLAHPLTLRILKKAKRIINRLFNGKAKTEDKVCGGANEPAIITGWKKQFDLKNLKDAEQADAHMQSFEEKCHILQECVDYCTNNSWHPVFVIPPVPETTRDYISKEFIQAFVYNQIQELQKANAEIPLFNHYEDDEFTQKYFNGEIFMNHEGQKVFSEKLFREISMWKDIMVC